MSNQLAISGGTPVRNIESKPWSAWPPHDNRGVGIKSRTAAPRGLFERERRLRRHDD